MGTTATNVTGAVKEINDKVGGIDVENNGDIATQLNAKANKNTEELVYYVSKNGNDNNDGLSLIENCAALGAPVPTQITDALAQLKNKKAEE